VFEVLVAETLKLEAFGLVEWLVLAVDMWVQVGLVAALVLVAVQARLTELVLSQLVLILVLGLVLLHSFCRS
jgi:hypothetical protein